MNHLQVENGGFTYIEILVCLVILALFITPMSYSFLVTIKMNQSAIDQDRVTNYTEQLMQDIQYQMMQDIIVQQKILGTRYKLEGKTETEIQKAKDGIGGYLIESDTREDVKLDEFLTSIEDRDLKTRYETERYAYEVALWRISDVSFINNTFVWNTETLKRATRIYSDQPLSDFYWIQNQAIEKDEKPITFQITPEMFKIFKDETMSYTPYDIRENENLEHHTIQFNPVGVPKVIVSSDEKTRVDIQVCDILDVRGEKAGYIFHLYERPDHKNGSLKNMNEYRSVIEVDVRNLLRKSEDLSQITDYDSLTFKFINHTDYNQLIQIHKNLIDIENENAVGNKFNVILEDKEDGKSILTQIDDMRSYENYLMAIVVRDKHPVQGKVYKVVKKMINVYSYRKNK